MNEDNIFGTDRKKQSLIIVFISRTLKTHQRETILFDFLRDTNRDELKIRKNDVTLK